MAQLTRFGRRVPLPSTVQIVHDFLVAQQNDSAQQLAEGRNGVTKADPELAPPTEDIRIPPQG